MQAIAIPVLAATDNPELPFDCVSVVASEVEPKPSFIVLLSGTVILQECYWPPRDDGQLIHSHESIYIQRNTVWVADGDLVFSGYVKAGARVRHKLGSLGFVADSEASYHGPTVYCDLEFFRVG